MTLRAKILAVYSGMIVCLIAVFYSATRFILLASFTGIEEDRVMRNMERVGSALAGEVEQLDFITRDWAWWDETCAYVAGRDEEFFRRNLNDVTLGALKIDAIVFVDPAGGVVYGTGFDGGAGAKTPLPGELARALVPGGPLTTHRDPRDRTAGIVALPSAPILIASRPILTGEGRGPIRGSLVMVRSLDSRMIRSLAAMTHVSLVIEPFRSTGLGGDFLRARSELLRSRADIVRPLGREAVAGYRLVPDIAGAPALLIRVMSPRDIYMRGLRTLHYLAASMLAIGLAFSAVFVVVLDRVILSPLGRLTARVDAIATSSDLSSRVKMGGRDELSRLAGSINGMLVALERAQEVLRRSEQDYRALFDNMLTGFAYHRIVSGADGKAVDFVFVEVNSVFEKLTHLARDSVVGKKASEVMPGLLRDDFDWIGMYGRVALTGATARVERYSSYHGKWYSLSAYSPRSGYFAILLDDITGRKHAEERMEHLTRVLRAIRGVDQLITREKDRGRLIAGACDGLVKHRGYSHAWIALLDDAGGLAGSAESGVGGGFAGLVERMKRGDIPDCGKRALEETVPVTVADPPSSCPSCPLATAYKRKGAMTVRLGYGGRVYGLLSVALPPGMTADDEESALFGELARDVAFALHGLEIEEGRSRVEASLRRMALDLKRSNMELEQFAYVASHDLQEPLRMVTSYLQLLERRYRDRLDPDAADFIRFAVDGADHMKRLISGLLEYSRLGTGDRPFAPTDCEAALDRALANLTVAISESGASVTHDPLPAVMADAEKLVQLFQNLVGNGIKFRREAPPKVHLSAARSGEEWIFSVSDNGIGIEPKFAERIFVIFQRLHGRDDYPGTGIGLALCRKIVEQHGGRIWVESRPGEGSVFRFTLPCDRAAAAGGGTGWAGSGR